jgi:CDP-diacylglycerol--glycerol-3-phosphate 3-phosphatidyltransferase
VTSLYDLKPRFQALLDPTATRLHRAGISPNALTLAALLLSLAAGAALALRPQAAWPLLALPAILFLRMALNALDGMIARRFALTSRTGAVLNELGDMLADAAIYYPLLIAGGAAPVLAAAVAVLAVVSEAAGLAGVATGAGRRYDGPLGKSDRAAVFGALALALGLGAPRGSWIDIAAGLAVALLLATLWCRAAAAARGPA